ncbi:Acetyltransferase (GNAT) domain-containing protein [Devosia enhydra]|uniref:Acetyltransferase (GNAT) domain-containing protein n=1 Tax=Devosia enhydra TaxID=665118 RepID=A0A1K2HVG5_9HYPH|nr:GNAT family N-acetyltransferase [Devosia enhydra]SFZ82746.1 Acetyltransferase (GNAT) domain-containing protein [Devosia enhydra]
MPHAATLSTQPAAAAIMATLRRVPVAEWDSVVADFDGVCQEQLVAFSARRWPGVVLEPVLVESGGTVLGGALMMIQRVPLGLGAIAVAKWAPMLADEVSDGAEARYETMISALMEEYADRRGMTLSILPRASISARNPESEVLERRGFSAKPELLFPNRYIVDLRLPDEARRKAFAQKWRYHLNKSEKAGLSFEHAGPESRPLFDALYETMVDRKKFPDHSAYETVPDLLSIADPRLRPELFFVRREGRAIAGAIIFKAGLRAVYLYGATDSEALDLRAGYFLHWHVIRWLRDNTRARWYDLGGTDGFAGLHQFKKGMVGTAGVIEPVPAVGIYASRPLPKLVGHAAFAMRAVQRRATHVLERLRPEGAKPDQGRAGDRQAAQGRDD